MKLRYFVTIWLDVISSGYFLSFAFRETASVAYWSEFLATDPEVRFRFPALADLLRSSGSGTGFTQPREYN
jgi:hypothetical protein